MSEPTSVAALVDLGERVLADSSALFDDHDFRGDAETLLAFCLGVETDDLVPSMEPPPRRRERFLSLIARRAGGEPLPFLTGRIEFCGLDLKVRPGAFVPRPSSELLVDWAATHLRAKQEAVVVDICTGTGPIALALADRFPAAQVWGTDISAEALSQGRGNAKRLGIGNVRFRHGDMYNLPARLRGNVDLIAGHVPYVPPDELDDLPAEVRHHEPVSTLSGESDDGLALGRRAVGEAAQWLKPGGWLLLEVSEDVGPGLEEMCVAAGLDETGVVSDEDRLSVVVEGRKSRRRTSTAG